MTTPTPPAISHPLAIAKVRKYLAALRGYNPAGDERFAEVVQSVCVSVAHLDATLSQFDQECPTLREIKDAALNLRERYLPLRPSQRQEWEKQYGPPDPGWSRALLETAKVQVSAADRKAQYKAESFNMRLQALKDAVYYSTPAGQAELNKIVGKEERTASRKFWADAIARDEREYPQQVSAIRAGREPDFKECPPPHVVSIRRPITAESFRGVMPAHIDKCTNCGGSGRLAGDDYCDECQTGRDLRRMESSHTNGGEAS